MAYMEVMQVNEAGKKVLELGRTLAEKGIDAGVVLTIVRDNVQKGSVHRLSQDMKVYVKACMNLKYGKELIRTSRRRKG